MTDHPMTLPPLELQTAAVPGDSVWGSLSDHLEHDIAQPLSSALQRVSALAESGRIDKASLHALRAEVKGAQRAARIGQRLGAITGAARRGRPASVDLARVCAESAKRCAEAVASRGIEVRTAVTQATVRCDAVLLEALVQTIGEWIDQHAVGRIEWRSDHDSWPANARLTVAFEHHPADLFADPDATTREQALDSLEWLLIQRMAARIGALLHRADTVSSCRLALTFLCTEPIRRVDATLRLDEGFAAPDLRHKSMAGYHLLLLGRREIRTLVRSAVAGMEMLIDHAATIQDAQDFCAGGLPHAVVYDERLAGEQLDALRHGLRRQAPGLVFVEVTDHDSSGTQPTGSLRIHRADVARRMAQLLARAFADQAVRADS